MLGEFSLTRIWNGRFEPRPEPDRKLIAIGSAARMIARTTGISGYSSRGRCRTSAASASSCRPPLQGGSAAPFVNWTGHRAVCHRPSGLMGRSGTRSRWCATARCRRVSSASLIGSMIFARGTRIVAMFSIRSRTKSVSPQRILKRRNVRRRQRRRTAQNIFENPLAALNGRSAVGIRSHQQHASLSQEASPASLDRHAAEVRP